MAWDLETARKHLDAWMEANLAVSTGQSYQIGSRNITRANLSEIQKQILFWRREVDRLENGRSGMRVVRVVPRDV
ncbi:hypothetical protein E0485_21750 [Paenibacillus albiflavus]|uniref:Uncharacterized protein n=1 Tax=Paenibacillus albiflavus TaxID=2545760 RepID=A0A4R4E0Z7_9BACL|nr:DUF6148 family protein [Paenibacillus albiflavus]TCZ73046.1 hypothetical protein E0485_21750 [Paenibacillus albiflavus]